MSFALLYHCQNAAPLRNNAAVQRSDHPHDVTSACHETATTKPGKTSVLCNCEASPKLQDQPLSMPARFPPDASKDRHQYFVLYVFFRLRTGVPGTPWENDV